MANCFVVASHTYTTAALRVCVKERERDGSEERSHSDKALGREVEKRKKVLKLFKGTVNRWLPPNILELRVEAEGVSAPVNVTFFTNQSSRDCTQCSSEK